MRKNGEAVWTAVCIAALMLMALPAFASAAEKSHEGMPGMKMEGHGTTGGHGDMKMGDKVYSGKLGPWNAEGRIMDMKAGMESSGMKMKGPMMNSHHVSILLTDPITKAPVAEGKGSVTVIAPDKSMTTTGLVPMAGHFGADVNLPKPGDYRFKVNIESGGKLGTTTFHHTVR